MCHVQKASHPVSPLRVPTLSISLAPLTTVSAGLHTGPHLSPVAKFLPPSGKKTADSVGFMF